jgi:hypothetical protein
MVPSNGNFERVAINVAAEYAAIAAGVKIAREC